MGVLSQVKLLENKNNQNVIKTLKKQASTLKISRKQILSNSASMSDYQSVLLDQKRSSQALLESCNSVMSFHSMGIGNDMERSARKPVRATQEAIRQLKRR